VTGGLPARAEGRSGLVPAVLSAATLFVVVVTIPIVLWLAAGWPLAHLGYRQSLRALSSRQSFDGGLAVHWLTRLAILVCWVTWMWTTVCIVLETRSWATGHPTTVPLPASATLHAAAACLVGTALAVSAGRVALPVPSPSGPRAVAVGTPSAVTVIDDLLAYEQADLPEPVPWRTTVRAGPFPSGDNGPDIRDDSALRHDSALGPVSPMPADPPGPEYHRVLARQTLWSIAADRLGSPSHWRALADSNYGVVQADGGALTSDHWVTPGWLLRLPQEGGGGQQPPGRLGSRLDDSGVVLLHHDHLGGPPVLPVGGSIVGAGVVNILDRMRRAQQRHRDEERLITLPEGTLNAVERRLRVGDGRDVVVEIDRALHALTRWWHDSGGDPPGIKGVRVHDTHLDLVVTVPDVTLPDGFSRDGAGRWVTVERRLGDLDQLPSAPGPVRSPAPLLVTAGKAADAAVMVNLEPLGSLVVEGDGPGCDAVLRALALELATSFWSDQFDLVLVGFGAELERFTRVTSTVETQDLVRILCHRRIRAHQALSSAGWGSFAEARSASDAPDWDPVAVIVGSSVAQDEVDELLASCADAWAGITVVAAGHGHSPDRQVVFCGPEPSAGLDLLGSVLIPQSVSAEDQADVNALLDLAAERSVKVSDGPFVSGFEQEPADATLPVPFPVRATPPVARTLASVAAAGIGPQSPGTVTVSVLGPIRIEGADRPFSRAWAEELVVYLAMHPDGASNEAWATALWPERLMAPSSLHSTASVARRALGKDSRGEDHLPRSHGRLALASSVTTDWARLEVLAGSEDLEVRGSALGLIRGRPFDGLRSSDWVILEGIGPGIEAFIVDLSGRVAGSYLAAGDPDGATWAARKGLLVSPYDERLYRMLMRSADRAGNPAGVESVMSELVQLVADDVEPFDSVHPATMDLYRSLTRRRSGGRRPADGALTGSDTRTDPGPPRQGI
jgi:hypothetical protein